MLNMYRNTSDNRYLNKTLNILAENVPCTFKDDTSAVEPTIIISPDAYTPACNYVYLSDTDRYYYVADRVFSQQRVEVKLSIDVRMSFNFSNCKCIANRSSNKYNSYLNDNKYTAMQYANPVLKKFDGGFNKNLHYVLTIAGGA